MCSIFVYICYAILSKAEAKAKEEEAFDTFSFNDMHWVIKKCNPEGIKFLISKIYLQFHQMLKLYIIEKFLLACWFQIVPFDEIRKIKNVHN